MEFAQTGFLGLTEIKEKVFAIIFSAELRWDLRLRRDEIIEVLQIPITKLSQGVCYFLRIADFRPDQPKREDERQMGHVAPFFTQIPKPVIPVLLSKSNRLIPN